MAHRTKLRYRILAWCLEHYLVVGLVLFVAFVFVSMGAGTRSGAIVILALFAFIVLRLIYDGRSFVNPRFWEDE